jgi:hypothetical protein
MGVSLPPIEWPAKPFVSAHGIVVCSALALEGPIRAMCGNLTSHSGKLGAARQETSCGYNAHGAVLADCYDCRMLRLVSSVDH